MEPWISDTSTSAGDLRTTSFAELLIELFEAGETGTLYVDGLGQQPPAVIRIEAGLPVRARVAGDEDSLLQALMPLCSRLAGSFAFAAAEDGLAVSPDLVTGRVDPRALIAAAARGPVRADVVAEVMVAIGRNLLRLNPRADLECYGFTEQERRLVDLFAEGPIEFAELVARSGADEPVLQRLAYVLRVTHALTILPSIRRTQSGTVEHVPAPVPSAKAPGAGRYSMVEPDHGTVTVLDAEPEDDEPILIEIEDAPPAAAPKRTQAAQARAHHERAEIMLKQRRYRDSLREARLAIKLGGGNAQCLSLYAWVLYQVNGAGDRVHPRVWEHLEHALKRDPLCERAHLYKAQLLKRVGRPDEAHWHFRRVLQIDRNNLEAAREVRLHEMRKRHSQPSGLMRRWLDRLK